MSPQGVKLGNIEAVAEASPEINPTSLWFSQGLTSDEQEYEEPCSSSTTTSGSISFYLFGRGLLGNLTVSTETTRQYPPDRKQFRCKYGSKNCSEVLCD